MYKNLNYKSKYCMKTVAFIQLILTSILLFIIFFLLKHFNLTQFYSLLFIIGGFLILLSLFDIFLFTNIKYKRYKYSLDSEKLEIIEGIFWITHSIIPLERLQQIALYEGPIDKHFGLVNLKVYTSGGSVKLSFITKEEGNALSKLLNKKINDIARGDLNEI